SIRGNAALRQSGAGAGGGKAGLPSRRLQPGRNSVGAADTPATVRGGRADANAGTHEPDSGGGTGEPQEVSPRPVEGPGSHRAALPGEGPTQALRHGGGTGGGSGPVPKRGADPGSSRGRPGARSPLGAKTPVAGRPDRSEQCGRDGADPGRHR